MLLWRGALLLTWRLAAVVGAVTATAEGMLEYTLDVVKLEPAGKRRS